MDSHFSNFFHNREIQTKASLITVNILSQEWKVPWGWKVVDTAVTIDICGVMIIISYRYKYAWSNTWSLSMQPREIIYFLSQVCFIGLRVVSLLIQNSWKLSHLSLQGERRSYELGVKVMKYVMTVSVHKTQQKTWSSPYAWQNGMFTYPNAFIKGHGTQLPLHASFHHC